MPKDLSQYRDWVKTCYEPFEFVPKPSVVYTNNPVVTSPVYQVAPKQFVSTNNGRPPLLPTPQSPFSPQMNIMTSPFSPYPPTSYGNHVSFFPENAIIIPTVSTHNSRDIVSTPMSTLHLNQPTIDMVSPVQQQVHYVVQAANSSYTQHQDQSRQAYPVSTHVHSPVKTMPPSNLNIDPLRNVISSMVQQRRNNASSLYSSKINNNLPSNFYTGKRITNTGRNSQRNSPRTSPKLNSRDFPTIFDVYSSSGNIKRTDPKTHYVSNNTSDTLGVRSPTSSSAGQKELQRQTTSPQEPQVQQKTPGQSKPLIKDVVNLITPGKEAIVSSQSTGELSNTRQSAQTVGNEVIVISDGE